MKNLVLGFLCVILFGCAISAPAQTGATLSGRIEAPGQMPAPGARVVLIDVATRQRKMTWTDASGNYGFANLPPGHYALFVSLIGFRPALIRSVVISGTGNQSQNVSLQLAMPGEQSARPMQLQGSPRGQTPPAGSGNPLSGLGAGGLPGQPSAGLRFSPEAATTGTSGQTTSSGNPSLQTSASADNSFLLTGNVMNVPAPSPKQKWKQQKMIMRSRGGGQTAPGFAGGNGRYEDMMFFFGAHHRPMINQIRGNISEEYTNSAFDARPYPLNVPESPQIPSYSETAGISLGGPLVIPKIYNGANKTSFFVHYTLVRSKAPFDSFATVPTLAERSGDFSNTLLASGPLAGTVPTIYQPFTGVPFTGNRIGVFNPAASALLAYIPLPNLPGQVQNFHLQESLPASQDTIMGRIGQQISRKDNVSVFYFLRSLRSQSVQSYPDLTSSTSDRSQFLNVLESHTVSAHTVNIITANFSRQRISLLNPFAFSQNVAGDLGIQGISQDPMNWGLPVINFTNFTGLNETIPSLTRNQTFRLSDFVITSRGNHNIHAGGEIRFIQQNTLTDPGAEGEFTFSGYTTSNFTAQGAPVNGTGFDFADFLLGLPQTTSVRFGSSANYLRSTVYDGFVFDDWRFSNHFTFDSGLRYEYFAPFTEKYGHLSDIAIGPGYSAAGIVTAQQPDSLPASLIRGQASNWSPRIGIAYRPWVNHSLVLRAGYGIFYDGAIYQQLAANLTNQPPFATASTLVTAPTQLLTLENGFPSTGSNTIHNSYAVDPNFLTPYAQTWDLMLEQQLPSNMVLSLAYIGTRGTHLNLLLAPNVASAGSPAAGQGSVLIGNAQPFIYDTSGASSIYNGLRVGLRRMFHNGFSFYADYTYSKAMDNAASVGETSSTNRISIKGNSASLQTSSAGNGSLGTVAQNPFDVNAEWGLSGFNPTHNFLIGYHYHLPFGENRPYLTHGGALARLLSSWEVSGFTTISSGTPYTAFVLGNLSNNVNGAAPFSSLRANVTGLPVTLPSSNQSTLEFFNTAAFTLPAPGQYGDAGRGTIPGPGLVNFNVSIDRRMTISREKNVSADIRISADNLLNTPNFTGIATTVNAANFGRVTSVGSMRAITARLRLKF